MKHNKTELVKQDLNIINEKAPEDLDSFRSVEIPKTQITGINRNEGDKADQVKEVIFPVSPDLAQVFILQFSKEAVISA